MARSEEAILRRALKRNRTEGEQRQADRNEMKRQALKQVQKSKEAEASSNERPRGSDAARSNQSRNHRSEERPRSQSRDRGNHRRGATSSSRPTKKPRHDEETSKKLVWGRQADSTTLSKNQELRQRYKETGGEGMDPKDLERAKLLIARDERKKERKNKKKKTTEGASTAAEDTNASTPTKEASVAENATPKPESAESPTKKKKGKNSSQAKRDQNKALRKRYLETNGKGMKEDQIERAKLLIARDEKKQKQRAQKQQEAEKKQ